MRASIGAWAASFILVTVPATAAEPEVPPAWLPAAARFLPGGYVLGQVTGRDDAASTVTVAAFPAAANDPAAPASAYGAAHELVLTVKDEGSGPVPVAGTFRERSADDPLGPGEADFAERQRELWIRGQAQYPAGTEPCDLGGWSIDDSPGGLAVHLAPSTDSRLLGTLPPRYAFAGASEAGDEDGYFTEFDIIGYRDGWFLIEHAEPPGRAYADPDAYPEDYPDPYAGRGWVPADKVGAQYANGDMPVRAVDEDGAPIGGLYQAPSTEAGWTPAKNGFGGYISADGGPKRIFACSGLWALVESHDGVTGWWRALCSNQVTNCS
jgi:hypothetical protein